jgi:hypothetical protein
MYILQFDLRTRHLWKSAPNNFFRFFFVALESLLSKGFCLTFSTLSWHAEKNNKRNEGSHFRPANQGCQIFLDTIYQNWGKYTKLQLGKLPKWPYIIPNGHTIYQPFHFRGPPKFTQIGIFGLKKYHLATLLPTGWPNFLRQKIGQWLPRLAPKCSSTQILSNFAHMYCFPRPNHTYLLTYLHTYLKKCSSLLQRWRISCKLKSRT